jgi:hypothetical protein
LSKIYPEVGESLGNYIVSIFGENIPYNSNIYCKFGQIVCDKQCTWISSTKVDCVAQAHPASLVTVYLSYNRLDWHPVTNKIQISTCESGYTAENYLQQCKLCPPGSYKQVSGLFECIPCPVDTYASFAGSTICEKCPTNTTTGAATRAISHSQCVCKPGFYLNPNQDQQSGSDKKCISCPIGASCESLNTTIPVSKPGYWNYKTDFNNFYLCKPKESCPGYSPENCTEGYKGIRCGQCNQKWYKFRGICNKCERTEITWIRLLALGGALAIITGIFFALSSMKVQHIASIAIAFSFWQVLSMLARFDIKWPSLIGGSLTASSISNFNVDFLSPNCIFPDMNYITLWVLQMMMPVAFLLCFCLIFFLVFLRSAITYPIRFMLGLCCHIKYLKPLKQGNYENQSLFKRLFGKFSEAIRRFFIYSTNIFIWTWTEKSNGRQFMKIFNRIVNAYFAFLSFTFIFIITTSSEIFVCTTHPDGSQTWDSSPDITCYKDVWFTMLPLSICWYIIFGIGSLCYFVLIFFKFKEWSKSTNFSERNKFMLSRFRKKLFFWEAVVTVRKTILSILYIFLDDMLVIVGGIFLLYVGFLLHAHFVPFKRKFQ